MLTPPDLSHDAIARCLADIYKLHIARSEFLPLGADVDSAVFRVQANDATPYFLKLRRGDFDKPVVAVPAFLHHEKGIAPVMAPLPTTDGQLSTHSHGFDWALYPFFDGSNGFERALTQPQWKTLGATLAAIHRTELPEALQASLAKETYGHKSREGVRRYQRRFINGVTGDDIVKRFFAFWEAHAEEIDTVVYRSEQLASILSKGETATAGAVPRRHPRGQRARGRQRPPVHRRLGHAGSRAQGARPDVHRRRRRQRWNQLREEAWFYEGYGPADLDAVALTHYRYERITKDLFEFCDQMFDAKASTEDREEGLRQMKSQFLPNGVVAIAHQSYDAIT